MIIGSNKQKDNIVQQGMVPRLIQLIGDPLGCDELKLEGQFNSSNVIYVTYNILPFFLSF